MSSISLKPLPLLVVDPDKVFLESLRVHPSARHCLPFLAPQHSEARRILTQSTGPFAGIFLSMSLKDIEVLSLVHTIHQLHACTPIYALFDEEGPARFTREMQKWGIQDSVHKPASYLDLINLLSPPFSGESSAAQGLLEYQRALASEVKVPDQSLVPVNPRHFYGTQRSLFDIYAKLESGRYAKLLGANRIFEPQRLQHYLEGGVENFYILKEDQVIYVHYCEQMLSQMARASTPSEQESPRTPDQIYSERNR